MFSKFIGCCFPTKNENLITKKDFNTEALNISNNEDDYLNNTKNKMLGNNYTMNNDFKASSLSIINSKVNRNKSSFKDSNKSNYNVNNNFVLTDISNHKYMNNIYSKNIILERLKLLNDCNDLDVFKLKMNNILQCKTIISNNNNNINNNINATSNYNNSSSVNINTNFNKTQSETSSDKIIKNARYFNTYDDRYYKSLELRSIFGDALNNEVLTITASGLATSSRKEKDGITFFGCKNFDTQDKVIDYELNLNSNNLSVIYSSIVFIIYFNKEDCKYYLKAVKSNKYSEGGLPNIIVQIPDYYYIKSKELLMLNDCYFQIVPYESYIDIIELPNRYSSNNKCHRFYVKDKKEIFIGRDKSCDIPLSWDKTYSKFQTTISYDEFLDQWKIIDGKEGKKSRNGSWVFASKSHEIVDNLVFRVANSKININVLPPPCTNY